MAKPAGPRCNLECAYCYYLGKEALLGRGSGRMEEALLERYIAQRLASSPGPVVHFEWHGGEPCLMGLGYFRTIVRLQKEHCPAGKEISNGLQTNGSLIDRAWADFLAREGFSVGLSVDGPERLHDEYRRTRTGGPSHALAMRAYRLLRERGVFVNLLCVVHARNALEPEETYGFFRALGASHLQFLPLVHAGVPRAGGGLPGGPLIPEAARSEEIGEFLCRVFDIWIREDVGRIVVQTFDEALRPIHGVPHSLCVHRETCGDVAVLEKDGSFYACDHYVDPAHLIGNLRERDLSDLGCDPAMTAFGLAKRESLPRFCRDCDVLASCNGGCPKDRLALSPDGESGLNVLCPAYKRFFHHSRSALERLSAHMRTGASLRSFEA
jgi:uncharacterized protein